MKKIFLFLTLFVYLILTSSLCLAESEISISVSPEIDISVERFASSGQYLILWLAPEYGLRKNHHFMARQLTEQKIEVWLSNIVESLYLPQSTNSLKQLDGKYVADLIDYAHKTTGKKIIIAGDSYAALNVLNGAHQWQQRHQQSPALIGAILFTPSLYAFIPSLGLPPEFMPIASATNIPMMIYQAQKSGNITQFKHLLEQLQQHDNPVYSKTVPNIRSLFYSEEPTEEIINHIKLLSSNIRKMITVLEKHDIPDEPVPMKYIKINNSGVDHSIKVFKGNEIPNAIKLVDAYGNTFSKNDFKGQITIVNFWATWCPPCVQEIPSLNRLKKKMAGVPFELISINYAEDKATILEFMEKVNVEFPVLLDQNGDFAKKWNVITYPSTFIIDPTGKIKYGVNAAIEWDEPEFIDKIKSLL
ncbi:MAG: TlpA family protein disulfide reductase [gamma proteobacterium symbiont of Taylorina sp.]|nr:TlpA family protein disulfide reductase [gamma proteobacterium symbiont of Taylorina sp.]